MPRLAAFPKAFMHALCKDGTMTVSEWIRLASTLEVEGLEWYAGFLEMADESNWLRFRREVEDTGRPCRNRGRYACGDKTGVGSSPVYRRISRPPSISAT